MSLAISPGLGTEEEQTLTASQALEVTWGSKPPRILTVFLDGSTGGYAFTGTDGGALGADRVDIPANTSYIIELRSGTARPLGTSSIFIESDASATGLQITKEA